MLTADPTTHRLSYRDLDHTPEDGNLYEIIDGALYVTPFPTSSHQNCINVLAFFLTGYVRPRRLGKVFTSGLKVVLDEPTGVGPDLVYLSNARLSGLREEGFFGPPDLVVEVLSSKPQLDRFVKLHKYASAGVPHYWIVDPQQRSLEVFRLEAGAYRRVVEIEDSGVFEPELFPGLSFDIAELWA